MVEYKPTVISLFAGCGGSSLGYKMAGYKELLAVEIDDNAVATFKLNFPEVPVLQKDITTITGDELISLCKIKKRELDVLDGSPPCQGFSTAGKRQVCDVRNDLVGHYIRLVSEIQPKVFVMENVSGMIKGKMKGLFIKYIKQMKELDYNVSCRVLNAKWFSVPQSRERMICIGVRKDIGEPVFPKAHDKIIDVGVALNNIIPTKTPLFNDKYAQLWEKVPIGGSAQDVIGIGFNNCRKLDPKKPSNTLPKLQTGRGFATLCRWDVKRAIAINEAKILQSFPNTFKFIGEYTDQWARIGNSVPPLMMKAIAETIKKDILD